MPFPVIFNSVSGLYPQEEDFKTSDFWVLTPPTLEPVTLSEVKEYIKLDGKAEDKYLESIIKAVRLALEGILGRSIMTQTIMLRLDAWPSNVLNLPRPPLVSVTAIRTLDEAGAKTVYSASNYYINTGGGKAQIVIKCASSLPSNYNRAHGGYEVEYIAGYGNEISDVPETIRQAVLQWVAAVYETKVPDLSTPPANVKATLGLPDRRIRI